MFYQLRMKLNYMRLNRQLAGVEALPPVSMSTEGNLMLLSLLNNRDVWIYLVALKSFCRFVKPSRVMIIKDPTLTDDDVALLKRQVPGVEFREMREFSNDDIPSGNCWERLSAISHFNTDNYVVQLDSDTITLQEPAEVMRCVEKSESFVLGTMDDQVKESYEQASSRAQGVIDSTGDRHPQLCAEAALAKLSLYENALYIKGCAGFSGFAPGSISPIDLVEMSGAFRGAIGDAWDVWGSEQFASNLLLSKDDKTVILPHPKYGTPDRHSPQMAFVHMIGPMRFDKGRYKNLGQTVIRELSI